MKHLEDKMSKRMADSIEQLAEIIKDYARKNRKLNERLGDVEVKLFGQSRGDDKKKPSNKLNTSNINNSSMLKASLSNNLGNKENSFSRGNKQ